MKLYTVFITYNRLALTKQAINSYLETVRLPYSYVVVDNFSVDGTQEWLIAEGHPCVLLGGNFYPGYACNRGWETAPDDATLLHRADNDFAFLPYWDQEVTKRFKANVHLGQLGLRTDKEELFAPSNVGGNNVIRRELWDEGLRYDERHWQKYPPGFSEDSFFSPAVEKMGYRWDRVKRPCIKSLADGDWDDPYYAKSYGDRRIVRAADGSPGTR